MLVRGDLCERNAKMHSHVHGHVSGGASDMYMLWDARGGVACSVVFLDRMRAARAAFVV